jgi:hypothetical protein
MNTWLTPMCQWGAAEDATTFGITCAVLGALLLLFIALGFGPLGTWLGMHAGRGRLARRSPGEASGLLATWRLYRQLGHKAHFSMPDVPSVMVPDSIAEDAQRNPPVSGPSTAFTGWRIAGQANRVDIDG